jgi:phospholipid/cholesterol/gamma-HCH transport system substrate-binding protein
MRPFRERNPVLIGFAGLVAIALMMLAAFRADQLPLIGGGDTYYAEFAEAGGLQKGDEVRIAGIKVGEVKEIALDGNLVRVEFLIDKGVEFGPNTEAVIRVKTLLGDMFVGLEPEGSGQLDPGSTIDIEHTTAPYDVVDAFSDLSDTTTRIDTGQLATSFDTVSEMLEQTPEEIRGTLDGLSRLSRNIAARDAQINSLLQNLDKVSGVLADRNQELVKLFEDGTVLFRAVAARRDAIHNLLVSTQQLSGQLRGLVADTRADLRPALSELSDVLDVLKKNEENLDESLRLMSPFYRVFANTLGSGSWWDSWIQNIPPAPALGLGGE